MTNAEFLSHLPKEARIPTEVEFEKIQLVYNYHPAIHSSVGKSQIAKLYSEFGMRIIYDMLGTAKRAQEIEDEKRRLRQRIVDLEQEYEDLSMI